MGAPGLDVLRRRPGRRQEPSRRGRAFVPRPPGVVDVRERASKRETLSRGREGVRRTEDDEDEEEDDPDRGPSPSRPRAHVRVADVHRSFPLAAAVLPPRRNARPPLPLAAARPPLPPERDKVLRWPGAVTRGRCAGWRKERARRWCDRDQAKGRPKASRVRPRAPGRGGGRRGADDERRGGRHGQCSSWVLRIFNNAHKTQMVTNKIQQTRYKNTHTQS